MLSVHIASVHAGFHHQHIEITVAIHLPAGGGAEEDDLLWLRHRHDAAHDLVEHGLIRMLVRAHGLPARRSAAGFLGPPPAAWV